MSKCARSQLEWSARKWTASRARTAWKPNHARGQGDTTPHRSAPDRFRHCHHCHRIVFQAPIRSAGGMPRISSTTVQSSPMGQPSQGSNGRPQDGHLEVSSSDSCRTTTSPRFNRAGAPQAAQGRPRSGRTRACSRSATRRLRLLTTTPLPSVQRPPAPGLRCVRPGPRRRVYRSRGPEVL